MKFREKWIAVIMFALGCGGGAMAADEVAGDRDWPAQAGAASVCLWADDALAACSITIDDNTSPDHPWWREMSKKYGLRLTWFIVTSTVDGRGWGGTWEGWRQLHADGHDVQSHTVNHLNTNSPTWRGPEAEYADSVKAIEANMPGNKVVALAYPGGKDQDKLNDVELAAKYFIGARGGVGIINPARKINYKRTNSIGGLHVTDAAFPQANLVTLFEKNTSRNSVYRGWYCTHYHGVKAEVREKEEKNLAYVHDKVASGDLWLGLFREVVQYGQERDVTTLAVTDNKPDQIALTLSNQLDARFDFPLTVKVRLPDGWSAAKAMQNEKPVDARVIEHDGARYALVKAVPNRGAVTLSKL